VLGNEQEKNRLAQEEKGKDGRGLGTEKTRLERAQSGTEKTGRGLDRTRCAWREWRYAMN
jgi:hypothetical protein